MLKPLVKQKHLYRTGNPDTRRCSKCGLEQPLDAFRVPMTEAQANAYGYVDKLVEGYETADGRFIRGHYRPFKPDTRLRLSQKCKTCHAIPKPVHYSTASFDAVQAQISHLRRKTLYKLLPRKKVFAWLRTGMTLDQVRHMSIEERLKRPSFEFDAERLYHGGKLRVLLDYALSKARERKNKGLACPPSWEKLLAPHMLTDVNEVLEYISRLRLHKQMMKERDEATPQ